VLVATAAPEDAVLLPTSAMELLAAFCAEVVAPELLVEEEDDNDEVDEDVEEVSALVKVVDAVDVVGRLSTEAEADDTAKGGV
jgi:hypothetical protein